MRSGTEKPAPPTSNQARKWLDGKTYRCIVSTSPGYKVGIEYTCYKNSSGIMCLRGSDGYEDLCSMLVSGFVVA